MSKFPVVLIVWADAHGGEGGWQSLEDLEDDGETLVQSVGFLVPAGEGGKVGHLTLWQSFEGGEGFHPFYIPVGMVRETRLLNNP